MQIVPDKYFAEGLTDWKNTLIQLTWQSHTALVYDRATFRLLRTFHYEGEGWSWNLKRTPGTPVPLKPIKTFSVAKGQALSLGEIAIELPAAVRKKMREQRIRQLTVQAEMNANNVNEDDPADFQP